MTALMAGAAVVGALLAFGWLDSIRIRRQSARLEELFPVFADYLREQAEAQPVSEAQWQELLDHDREQWA